MTPAIRRLVPKARECAASRPALLGLLEDPLGAHLLPEARTHLETCARCRAEFADVVLMSVRLQRVMAEARVAQPAADAWPRLRARVTRTSSSGRAPSGVVGLAVAAGLALAIMVPLSLPLRAPRVSDEAGVDSAALRAADDRDAAAEAHMQWVVARTREEPTSTIDSGPLRLGLARTDQAPDDAPRVRPMSEIRASAL